MTIVSPECGPWNVFLSNSELVITRSQVDLRVDTRPLQLIKQVVNSRKRISVPHNEASLYGDRATDAAPGTKLIKIQLVE
ncbi:hypothetical protein Tco_0982869 [Tanacetum coccineum]